MVNKNGPNILVTGTPGTGKSVLCEILANTLGLRYESVSALAKELHFTEDYDDQFDCAILDEDKLLDYLEPVMATGGIILEYHACDLFPERWFDAIFVLRCNNTILYDRLKERDYSETKVLSNIDCEIFQTILDEARNSYKPEIVFEVKNETEEDLEVNVQKVTDWYYNWKAEHESEVAL